MATRCVSSSPISRSTSWKGGCTWAARASISDAGLLIAKRRPIARTQSAAIQLAGDRQPDLILADIQLADGSSGIDAVNELLGSLGDIPVIFITAFPERLLTGDKPEPAFLITKPFQRSTVKAAIAQALFFDSQTVPA